MLQPCYVTLWRVAAHQLQLFESTKDIYYRVFRRLKPRTVPPEIVVAFKPYANANCYIRWRNQHLHVLLADSLRLAPVAVAEAIAVILICKIYRREVPEDSLSTYREYMNDKDTRTHLERIRKQRGRKQIESPQGQHFDLDAMFDALNQRYFESALSKPRIGWSKRPSIRTLGHYDPVHHAIVLSKFLDKEAAGYDLVEYVLYHEMLHIKHPIDYSSGRRKIHPKAFREEEARYPEFDRIKEKLRDYCHRKHSSL